MSDALPEQTSRNTHATVARLLTAEPDCRTVLDIPSGRGAMVARLRAHGLQACGVDVLAPPPGVAVGRPVVRADMNARLPFADASFDAVACVDGVEHLERPFDFIRECHRVVRPGGVLVLSTPNISALRSRWRWLLTGFHQGEKTPLDEASPNPWHHIGLLSFPDLRYLLHANGFRITQVATNRVKPVSWLYLPLWPVGAVVTAGVFRRWTKDPAQRPRNAEIRRQLFSLPVAFGETLIVKARRV